MSDSNGTVSPAPEEVLRLFALAIRTARTKKRLSQAQLAKNAGVSLAQLALMEKGRNVSLLFLAKVAGALDLTLAINDASDETTSGTSPLDIFALLRRIDLVAVLIAELREVAVNAALPSTAAKEESLRETAVVDSFLARVLRDDREIEKLGEAMHAMSSEATTPKRVRVPGAIHTTVKRRKAGE